MNTREDNSELTGSLAGKRGKEYWRSLEELAQTPAFQQLLQRELPSQAEVLIHAPDRRRFLTLMAASLGLAGLSGCSPSAAPTERIVPYVTPPEGMIPGKPLYFATAMALDGDALGLLVESHEGRPTKIEGNPDHPSSPRSAGAAERTRFGATSALAQAAILGLYDPDRSSSVTYIGSPSTWDGFQSAFARLLSQRGPDGAANLKVRVLTGSLVSPSLAWQLRQFLQAFPQAKWHVHDPLEPINTKAGAKLALGEVVQAQYDFERADVVVALDADFLNSGCGHVRNLHGFSQRRRRRRNRPQLMNRLYVVESSPTGTGAIADHRLPVRSADIETVARALANQVDRDRFGSVAPAAAAPAPTAWIAALASDLRAHRGRSLVIAGEKQPAFVHALAHALNDFLGNTGQTVTYTTPVEFAAPEGGSLADLAAAMDTPGTIDLLLVLGTNPVYSAPADLRFPERMSRVPLRIHLGLYEDETAQLCHWHVPQAHFLESWGDVRAAGGTVSFVQPLIAPLHGGKTASELLAHLTLLSVGGERASAEDRTAYGILRGYWRSVFDPRSPAAREIAAYWRGQGLTGAFVGPYEAWWQKSLRDGLVAGTALPAKTVQLRADALAAPHQAAPSGLELVMQPDPALHDGSYANNGWLQELPRPISKLTWDNAIYVSPATAIELGLAAPGHPEDANERTVELGYQGNKLEGPVWVMPGQADRSILIHLGHGRHAAGRVGNNVGFSAYRLRTSSAPWIATGATIQPTGRRKSLACTQHHHLLRDDLLGQDRGIVLAGTVESPPRIPVPHLTTLYNDAEHHHPGNQWGMAIDLSLCSGCNACVVACQAENNIPVVGKDQVERGREMHWLRIDSYYRGEPDHPEIYMQPVMCMHCENAPCELVCPVGATVHSDDGLNDMVYNRCVGTRYCSNNCPYKVRRFNFLQYSDFSTESARLPRNPEVTVRSRGVMEKCTYCVQRIRTGQITAEKENRAVRDGEVVTACQAVCPAGAITFGDLADRTSHVAAWKTEPLHYALLDELNTRPRTTYLAALKNPNPEIR
jgi:MoCo/4Fe-4S cofactor protein with predicted Tat translocation signal